MPTTDALMARQSSPAPLAPAPELSIIMPVFNEEQALPGVLDEAVATVAAAPFSAEIVVVDDASTDTSLALLQDFQRRHPELAVRVLRHESNRGIAAACATLFSAARGEYVFLNSSDGQCSSSEALRMMGLRGQYDLVIGKRRDKHYSCWRALISWAYNVVPWLFFGVPTHDAGSVKLIRSELLRIPLVSRGPFSEAERIIRASRQGYRIGVVPIDFRPRRGGKARGARWRLVARSLVDALRCWWDVVICSRF
jgi:glycosyltransferase involved in cell wall biosynthesis